MSARMCKCGGQFRSIDLVIPVPFEGRTIYDTIRIKKGYVSSQCDKCRKIQEQKLRISKGTPNE